MIGYIIAGMLAFLSIVALLLVLQGHSTTNEQENRMKSLLTQEEVIRDELREYIQKRINSPTNPEK